MTPFSLSSILVACVAGMLMPGALRSAERDVPFDAAPFGQPLADAPGVLWEDPREIHRVIVHFQTPPPPLSQLGVEYWGSWWPERHLPKDREPGGGDVGWLELGNWYRYQWRRADVEATRQDNQVTFVFRPVTEKEFPRVKDYPVRFRYTLKLRVVGEATLPPIDRLEAYTDSRLEAREVTIAWDSDHGTAPVFEVFNGVLEKTETLGPRCQRLRLQAAVNPDPNTFDRTLVTVRTGGRTGPVFTFRIDDLSDGPLFLPQFGAAVWAGGEARDYAALAAQTKARGAKTLYDRVIELPEQTWTRAWQSMPPKKSHIYFPLGLDGGRQRFRLDAEGSLHFRSNDHYLKSRPGRDTARLALEKDGVSVGLGTRGQPANRTLEEQCLPVCLTTWDQDGLRVTQTAFVTRLEGMSSPKTVIPGDALTVFMAKFEFTNPSGESRTARLPLSCQAGGAEVKWRQEPDGCLWVGDYCRGQVLGRSGPAAAAASSPSWQQVLAPGHSTRVTVKIPYLVLTNAEEVTALKQLEFDREHKAVADYWRQRLDESARLITPEPMLNEFYRSHAMHLLVNCEREPGSDRRFARVGSFSYGAYGNESCMMVIDLERRGYHREAQECLDAWLHYQGTVGLPGSFATREGVLYGAGGYEAGGYNQHHGWILWMLAEHYRFTRDANWLRRAAPGILAGAEWIIRETARTRDRHELERGLLPAGSLEDIGDWWTWLSTSCYTWRGLDRAAWALAQLDHPEAPRIRLAAGQYRQALLANFRQASERSPVVRLRDGTAIPQIPSHVHRRGRSFGWICQTLEGAIHLLISGVIDEAKTAELILKDYEDNLYLSNQFGYTLDDFERHWFDRGGISMQACLLLGVEPYLHRDEAKHALRALFNGLAVSYFPDVRMNTEHALPEMGDWRGDHFKSSDESNCAGWLRYLFVRETDEALLLGQAIPREWLRKGARCGMEKTATWFGPVSVDYQSSARQITARFQGAHRNPPPEIRLRFRHPQERLPTRVTVNGKPWTDHQGEWVRLPGTIGQARVVARY